MKHLGVLARQHAVNLAPRALLALLRLHGRLVHAARRGRVPAPALEVGALHDASEEPRSHVVGDGRVARPRRVRVAVIFFKPGQREMRVHVSLAKHTRRALQRGSCGVHTLAFLRRLPPGVPEPKLRVTRARNQAPLVQTSHARDVAADFLVVQVHLPVRQLRIVQGPDVKVRPLDVALEGLARGTHRRRRPVRLAAGFLKF